MQVSPLSAGTQNRAHELVHGQNEGRAFAADVKKEHEFPFWLSGKNLASVHEDAGSIPDPVQWVKDLALLRAAV